MSHVKDVAHGPLAFVLRSEMTDLYLIYRRSYNLQVTERNEKFLYPKPKVKPFKYVEPLRTNNLQDPGSPN